MCPVIPASPSAPVPAPALTGRERRSRDGVAFVLTGGGAKGCFEAGAIAALADRGIRPQIVCGISVGALNAVKVAEGGDAAAELAGIWEEIAARSERHPDGDPRHESADVYEIDSVIDRWVEMVGEVLDVQTFVDWFGRSLADSLWGKLWRAVAPGTQSLADDTAAEVIESAVGTIPGLHSVHTFNGLRHLIARHLDPDAILRSGTILRVGFVDVVSGQLLFATEPRSRHYAPERVGYGRIETEAPWLDHGVGHPRALDVDISLADAVYASSAMPIFMPPLEGYAVDGVDSSGGSWRRLETHWPREMARLMAGTPNIDPSDEAAVRAWAGSGSPTWSEERERRLTEELRALPPSRGGRGPDMVLFDGGLLDIVPIRTAMRLGARTIYVITGTDWRELGVQPETIPRQRYLFDWGATRETRVVEEHGPEIPYGENSGGGFAAVFRYLRRLIDIYTRDVGVNDMMLAVAFNEFLGWLYRAYSLLTPEQRQQFLNDFNQYWMHREEGLGESLQAGTWLGDRPFRASSRGRDDPSTSSLVVAAAGAVGIGELRGSPYGNPFADEACRIVLIAPQEAITGALDFSGAKLRRGLELGREAGRSGGVELSFPVGLPDLRE